MTKSPFKKMVFFILKATSELDFVVPLIWGIKRDNKDVDIDIIYFSFNKKNILRDAEFYSKILKDLNVAEYDLSDFLVGPLRFFKEIIKKTNEISLWDIPKTFIGRCGRGARKFFNNGFSYFTDLEGFLDRRSPDICFFPIRNFNAPCVSGFFKFIYREKPRVVLYPHGSFGSSGWQELYFGGKKGLPEFCFYWYPIQQEETIKKYPQYKGRILFSGYPGNDAKWLEFLKLKYCKNNVNKLRVLFVIRKFGRLPNENRTDSTLTTKEFRETLELVSKVTEKYNVELIVKPHPQNDYATVEKVLQDVGYGNWVITYEPIYTEAALADMIFSFGSTTVTISSLLGKPLILFNDSITQEFLRWEMSNVLFGGLSFRLKDISNFENMFLEVKKLCGDKKALQAYRHKTIAFFREYYPEDSIDIAKALLTQVVL